MKGISDDELNTFIKDDMKYSDYSELGGYILKRKIQNLKLKIKGAFKRKK